MKKGFRQYAVRTDTNEERRHISTLAAMLMAHHAVGVEAAIDLAFRIADAVDKRIMGEIEEVNAEQSMRKKHGDEEKN
jgi:hypothetical protein